MAQSGFTPIQLFRTTTAAAVPTAGSLADGELAINLTDEKLYFKNASGVVKLLASAGGAAGTVTSVDVSGGTTGLTFSGGPITSSGTITMAGTLGVANGGTGASTLTSGYLLKGNGTSAVSASVIYDDGTNVGIGTSSPGAKLDVVGAGVFKVDGSGTTTPLILRNNNTTSVQAVKLGFDSSGAIKASINAAVYGNDYMTFNVGSDTERMRITSGGDVLVGKTTASVGTDGAQLLTTGYSGFSAAGTTALFLNRNTSDGTILEFGRNGVSTATMGLSSSALTFGTAGSERMRIDASGSVTANVDIRAPIFYDSGNTAYYLDPTGSTSLNVAGNMLAAGNVELGNGANRRVRIGSATNYNYDLQTTGDDFQIIEAGTTPRLTIKYPNGYVGIGTTSPSLPLVVSNAGAGGLEFNHSGAIGNGTYIQSYNRSTAAYIPNTNYALSQTWYSGATRAMDLNSSGNLGIGTTSPGAKLHVAGGGNIRLTATSDGSNGVFQVYDSASSTLFQLYNDSTKANLAVVEAKPMVFYTTNTERMRIASSGSVTANVDLRAPIFYDSNDTAYYIDAAGNNVLNTLYFRTGSVQAKFAQASNFGYSASYRTVVLGNESLTTISMGVDVSGNASGSFNGQGEGREIIFRNGVNFITPNSANNSYLNPFGMADGYAYSTGSFRAPIFYDSNNTGYYLDPASTSNLNALTLAGTINNAGVYGRSAAGIGYLSGGYNGAETNSTTGPIYCISTGYAPTSTTLGSMYGIGYTDGGSAGVWSGGGWGMYAAAGGVARVFLDASNGIIHSTASVRSPVFYDSQDTSYFLDPNSTSVLSTVRASTIQFSSGNTAIALNNASYQILYDPTARPAIYLGGADPGNYYDNTGHYFRDRSGTQYGSITASGMFANVFYDYGNTAYYVDPASTTTSIQVAGAVEQGNNYAHPQIEWSSSSATGMVIFYLPGTTSNYGMVHMVFDIYEYVTGKTATVIIGGHNWSTSWYNTGVQVVGWTDKTVRLGVKNGRFCVIFGGVGSSWTYGTIRLRKIHNASFYDNIMDLGGNWSTELTNTESFTTVTSDLRQLRTSNTFTADGDVRSPIFYDSDNTAYYVNPAGTSYVSGDFQVQQSSINGIRLLSTTGTQSLWIRAGYDTDGSPTPASSPFNIQFQSSGSSGGTFTFVTGNTKALTIAGDYAQGAGSLRAPIFYDSNNTSFYIDAASTSNINQLNGNGKIVLETSDSYLRINQHNGFSNGIWMGPSNIGGSGELHLGSNGTPSTARVRVIGGTYNGSVVITLNGADGSITAAGNVTAYSDIRVKDNVETIPAALAKLSAIRGVTYTRTDLDDKERRYAGVIAQEIEQVLPEAVREINDIKTVDYNATIALLIQAVKELSAEVQLLKAKEY